MTAPTPADNPWTVRQTALGALVEHEDGTRLRPVGSRIGESSTDVAQRVAAALNDVARLETYNTTLRSLLEQALPYVHASDDSLHAGIVMTLGTTDEPTP